MGPRRRWKPADNRTGDRSRYQLLRYRERLLERRIRTDIGDVLGGYDRDRFVVATKVYGEMDTTNPNASGLSRRAIDQELSNSLERLDMDTIDLYQTHRWDHDTPIEETLRTLNDAVRREQSRYIGTSSQWAHQLSNALHTSDRLNLERFRTMQNHYNLVYREEEREMIPLCDREGIGLIPWSPLARGYLTRPHEEFLETVRGDCLENSQFADRIDIYRSNGGKEINERVKELAREKGVTMA